MEQLETSSSLFPNSPGGLPDVLDLVLLVLAEDAGAGVDYTPDPAVTRSVPPAG